MVGQFLVGNPDSLTFRWGNDIVGAMFKQPFFKALVNVTEGDFFDQFHDVTKTSRKLFKHETAERTAFVKQTTYQWGGQESS